MVSFAEWFMDIMKELGLYRIWIPFLFTFVVLYVSIKMFLGDKINEKLTAVISFLASFFIIYTAQATDILVYYTAILIAFIVFVFLGLILLGFFGVTPSDLQSVLKGNRAYSLLFLIILVVLFFIALNLAYGKRISTYIAGGQVNVTNPFALAFLAVSHPAVIGTFFTLITFGILAYILMEQK